MTTDSGRVPPAPGSHEPSPDGLGPSGFDPSREAFDQNGIPFALGDVVKVFHFVGARRKRHYMYKQVVGERVWPSGYRCWLFSHLNLKPAEGPDGGFYVARDGRHHRDYEIVQCCSAYPAHFTTRPRDSDEHPKGEDAERLSGEAMPARAEGIAQPGQPTPTPDNPA